MSYCSSIEENNNIIIYSWSTREFYNRTTSKDIIFISTPFSRKAAYRLKEFNVPAYKIGSGECNNYPLIEHIAKFGKPMILRENIWKTKDFDRKALGKQAFGKTKLLR